MAQILIGCRLPHGIIIEHNGRSAELAGANRADEFRRSPIIILHAESYGLTRVDAELWDAWSKANASFPALKNGSIFVAKNESEADAIVAATASEKTGFEAMPQSVGKVKAAEQ